MACCLKPSTPARCRKTTMYGGINKKIKVKDLTAGRESPPACKEWLQKEGQKLSEAAQACTPVICSDSTVNHSSSLPFGDFFRLQTGSATSQPDPLPSEVAFEARTKAESKSEDSANASDVRYRPVKEKGCAESQGSKRRAEASITALLANKKRTKKDTLRLTGQTGFV